MDSGIPSRDPSKRCITLNNIVTLTVLALWLKHDFSIAKC